MGQRFAVTRFGRPLHEETLTDDGAIVVTVDGKETTFTGEEIRVETRGKAVPRAEVATPEENAEQVAKDEAKAAKTTTAKRSTTKRSTAKKSTAKKSTAKKSTATKAPSRAKK